MGILDLFGGGKSPEKALKLKSKVTQKYGDPTTRQKAIAQLGEMKFPEAVSALMARFTVTVEPSTTDLDEKDHVFTLVTGMGQAAVEPVKDFLRKSDHASSWALRILGKLLPGEEVIAVALDLLEKIGPEYTRDPEKKTVLLHHLHGKSDPRIGPVAVRFLEDPSDEVKLAAIHVLGPLKFEPAREPLLALATSSETARRVQAAALAAVAESGFGVQGYREKVEAVLPEAFTLTSQGTLQKRP